jgi:hypothetical protein
VREILYLCVFAPLRLCVPFFQRALRAVLPLTPPPYLPQPKPWGRGGAKRFEGADGIVVDRLWVEWLFGFSPEGGTWTAISA